MGMFLILRKLHCVLLLYFSIESILESIHFQWGQTCFLSSSPTVLLMEPRTLCILWQPDPQSSIHSEESSPSMDGGLLPLAAWRELSSATLPQPVYSVSFQDTPVLYPRWNLGRVIDGWDGWLESPFVTQEWPQLPSGYLGCFVVLGLLQGKPWLCAQVQWSSLSSPPLRGCQQSAGLIGMVSCKKLQMIWWR